MKIFSEPKNKYVLATIVLINRISSGECIPVNSFDKEFFHEADDNNRTLALEYLLKLKNEYGIFDFSNKNKVGLCIKAPMPIFPSMAEKVWLKSALNFKEIRLFLPNHKIEELQHKLSEVPDINMEDIIGDKGVSSEGDIIDQSFIIKFRTILYCIQNQKYLIYCNKSRDGKVYENETAIPIKIEYSVTQQKYRVSMWSTKEQRPIKANIQSMYNVHIGENITQLQFNSVKEMLEQKRALEPLIIKIFNENNAVERASLLFSQYDRTSRWEDDTTLIMEIKYYVFDEEELIGKIMSFGPKIKVIGPVDIVKKVIVKINNNDFYRKE